jgi:hypothetical protein
MIDIQYVEGDLVEMIKSGECDAAAHGCNCFHTMGAGIARALKDLTECDTLAADMETPYGDINKLGSFSIGYYTTAEKKIPIYNLYTQYTMASPGCVAVHWDSVFEGLIKVVSAMRSGSTLAIPYIGCGLAGGEEQDFIDVVESLNEFEDELPDVHLKIVKYKG